MLKFVTFNLRRQFEADGPNQFNLRKPLIQKKLLEESPDLICFQEVLPDAARWLKESLPGYQAVGCGRGENLDDEQMTVAFRTHRLNLIQMKTFWLSDTPDRPGSRFAGQSPCPRSCTEALFQDLEENRVFRVFNFHLDHENAPSRQKGLHQVLEQAASPGLFPHAPVILAGDFNAYPGDPELAELEQSPGYENATENLGTTYHGYGNAPDAGQIDYIYSQKPLKVLSVTRWTDCENGVWLSDHYPVCALLDWDA